MIRETLLWALVAGTVMYAWVDWFRALLVLILLMAVYQHPDMPRELAGLQGLNPWNVLLVGVCLAWLATRWRAGKPWDLPRPITLLLLMYAGLMLVSSIRAIVDPNMMANRFSTVETTGQIVGELLFNTFKWMILPILLFDGCRDRRRLNEALFCVLAVYVLIALQVAKYMPPQFAVDGDTLARRAIRVLEVGVGYHRVNLSAMLAGASWAVFATRIQMSTWRARLFTAVTALFVVYAQAMTAGRAGYVAWVLVGLTLCVLRWRRYLLGVPVMILAIVTVAPGVSQRMLAGFSEDTRDSNPRVEQQSDGVVDYANDANKLDAYTVTSGRSVIWPFVIAKIEQAPWVGYGRMAMQRTRLTQDLWERYGEPFPHPHNAYLELLLDSGVIGAACVLPFYIAITFQAMTLFRDSRSPTCVAVGGACLAVVLSLLYGAIGSQTFYPREGWMGMWCLIGLMLRVRVQRSQALSALQGCGPSAPARSFTSSRNDVRGVSGQPPDRPIPHMDDVLWHDIVAIPVPSTQAA
jgi:O-antigen ligase